MERLLNIMFPGVKLGDSFCNFSSSIMRPRCVYYGRSRQIEILPLISHATQVRIGPEELRNKDMAINIVEKVQKLLVETIKSV